MRKLSSVCPWTSCCAVATAEVKIETKFWGRKKTLQHKTIAKPLKGQYSLSPDTWEKLQDVQLYFFLIFQLLQVGTRVLESHKKHYFEASVPFASYYLCGPLPR